MDKTPQQLNEYFFNHPEWVHVENLLLKKVDELRDMSSINTSQPAEHVKAEIIGRNLAYKSLLEFLNETKFVSRPLPEQNIFK